MRSMLPCTSNPVFLKAFHNQFQCSFPRTANPAIVPPVICTHDCASRNHTVLVNEVDLYFWHATNSISQSPKESFVQHDRHACFPFHRKVNPTVCFQLRFHWCGLLVPTFSLFWIWAQPLHQIALPMEGRVVYIPFVHGRDATSIVLLYL